MKKPIIGINGNLTKDGQYAKLSQEYSRAVLKAGGIPIILPPFLPAGGILSSLLDRIGGLLLSGGHDLSPRHYNEKILNKKVILLPELKQRFDLALAQAALKRKMPILGTCYGAQLINVALGGNLFQDIAAQIKSATCPTRRSFGRVGHRKSYHKVYLCEGTLLHRILGKKYIITNSTHHQAIKTPGRNLIINARAEDAIIEGIELPDGFCLGLQWHPERMMDSKEQVGLLRAFIQYAAR